MIFIILIIISISYAILIITLSVGFDRVPVFLNKKTPTNINFSIIIPFRNEGVNISTLANSLIQLNYPKENFEVLWVNDGSTDNSVPLLTEFIIKNRHWKLLDNHRKSGSAKKDAIETAIKQTKFDWIVTTDADCIVPVNWLDTFNCFIETNKENIKMIAAPVAYKTNNSFLQQFQSLDFLSLIGTTIGAFGVGKPFMCNGANLCYSKQTFFDVSGFEGNNTIASGDDVFLLEKIVDKYPKQIRYLKSTNALVLTKPEGTYKKLINQRVRWASKTSATKSVFGKLVGVIVFLMNIISLWLLVFGLWFINYSLFLSVFLFVKLFIDYILINKTHQFVHQKLALRTYFIAGFLYPFFVTYVVVKSFTSKVVWKDRKV